VKYVQTFDDVWVCRRAEIADHWRKNFPAPTPSSDRSAP
jgi:hypothetical protein